MGTEGLQLLLSAQKKSFIVDFVPRVVYNKLLDLSRVLAAKLEMREEDALSLLLHCIMHGVVENGDAFRGARSYLRPNRRNLRIRLLPQLAVELSNVSGGDEHLAGALFTSEAIHLLHDFCNGDVVESWDAVVAVVEKMLETV